MSDEAARATAADVLVAALAATLDALQSGDLAGAAAAVDEVNRSCAELSRLGASMSPERLLRARELQSSCEVLAGQRQAAVVAEVLQSATHRRASDAYGSKS